MSLVDEHARRAVAWQDQAVGLAAAGRVAAGARSGGSASAAGLRRHAGRLAKSSRGEARPRPDFLA